MRYPREMRFLKRSKIPDELPDLALGNSSYKEESLPQQISSPLPFQQQTPPKPIVKATPTLSNATPQRKSVGGDEYLDFSSSQSEAEGQEIKKQLIQESKTGLDENSFFDKILEDINGEIKDLGKLEHWYENKFLPQDVVSNMRDYWESNKAEMIIRSFGSEYKEKINEKIKKLQELESDWREIYFKLIKKEEEMKKQERALKETLSEFVDLCKRRSAYGEKKEQKE